MFLNFDLQVSLRQLCQIDAASIRAEYSVRVHGVLDTLCAGGHVITQQIERAHAAMCARWDKLFPSIQFVDDDPGNMNKYVVPFAEK